MPKVKDAVVWLLGRLGLALPAYRLWEAYHSRRADRTGGALGDDGLPLPTGALMLSVAGTTDTRWFEAGGALAVQALRDTLKRHDLRLEEMGSILEFGCGCGRVVRHLGGLPGEVHATDWNPKATAWCARNLDFATFETNQLAPPLPYADESFDLIYTLSVFTHMGEDLQLPWMTELRRVLRRGGHLIVTTHGAHYCADLEPALQRRFEAGEFLVRRPEGAGTNLCSAFHPEAYLRGEFTQGFEFLEWVPEGALGNPRQDLTLLRKPLGDPADATLG